jgi:hypothetical protein
MFKLSHKEAIQAFRSYELANSLSLEIYDYLLSAYNELSQHYGPYGNIIGLFFHDLMIHFSGIIIQREFIWNYGEDIAFPYVSKNYALQPFLIDSDQYFGHSNKSEPLPMWRTKGIISVAAGNAVPLSATEERLLRSCFSLLTRYQPFAKAFLPARERQLERISMVVDELATKYDITERDCLIQNWSLYASHHTCANCIPTREDALVVGTRTSLQNRKLAINFLQQGRPVIGMTHGEITNSIFDEPLFGYAELGLCTTLVDYGSKRVGGRYNSPLAEPVSVIGRASASVKKLYKCGESVFDWGEGKKRLLYVPTIYNGNLHYGPYRGFEDNLYVTWQEQLLAVLPDATIKAHPKSLPSPAWKRVESRPLEACLSEYDVLVLDYYSTAATLAISSDRPVIFFDIGLRNLVSAYKDLVRSRCHYVDIDWGGNLQDQINEALRGLMTVPITWDNSFLHPFSITNQTSTAVLRGLKKYRSLIRGSKVASRESYE